MTSPTQTTQTTQTTLGADDVNSMNGVTLHDTGPATGPTTGPTSTVVVLHGGGGPASMASVVEHLRHQHRVITPVHPGWEGTAHLAGVDTVPDLAALHLHLLRAMDLTDVVIVASSFGGWVAAEMSVLDDAERIAAVVLLDAIGIAPQPGDQPAPADDAPYRAPSPGQSPKAFALLQHYTGPTMWDPDLAERLEAVDIPALVVWGADDPVLTSGYGRRLAACFSQGSFAEIPDAGHLPANENPAATWPVVDRFMAVLPEHGGAQR